MTVDLRELLAGLALGPVPAGSVTGLTDDSRAVSPGDLFLARRGPRTDGRAHIAQALDRGAAAVACEGTKAPAGTIAVPALAEHTGTIAERFFGHPARDLRLAGITGTNGKTTVAHLTREILLTAGVPTAMIGTLGATIGSAHEPTGLTTPGAVAISRLLSAARQAGERAVVMEVSSHALAQHRVAALDFDAGVLTNLTRDHLDDHGNMDAYARAKARLFTGLAAGSLAVVNADDPASPGVYRSCPAAVTACSARAGDAVVRIADDTLAGMTLELTGPWGSSVARTRLRGAHNALNALQAAVAASRIATLTGTAVTTEILEHALGAASAPAGRLERVDAGEGPVVLVDYAHTEDALRVALTSARGYVGSGGRLWVVFGCGGDRDRGKRPAMGRIAAEMADVAVVTSDNPRREDPSAIVDEVAAGSRGPGICTTEPDRERAITATIRDADPGDVVLIAGKGHEDYQLLPDGAGGVTRRDFDDRRVARLALGASG